MNQLFFRIFCQALLIAAMHGLGYTVASAQSEYVARIHVVFLEPEKFTDAKRAEFKPNSEVILDDIAKFMQEMGEETIHGI